MSKTNIPLTKNEIMEILQLGSLPRNWKSNGATLSACHGAYTFENGFALSMFSDCLKKLMEMLPNATRDSLFCSLFESLSKSLPSQYKKLG